ncbi:MAG: MBL fold metallo-hydrolase [Terriglobia bacterium]|jgi:flavorubredoxin|nr:MBL fold metallo-hydrolase [Terriglobia bacterium]
MSASIHEIAPDLYRINIFFSQFNLGFNHFLVKDEEPLLFHTGFRATFPEVREAVDRLIEPGRLRYISFGHFEPDECGALNEWLAAAPRAETIVSTVGSIVTTGNFADRPPRALQVNESFSTGKYRFRYINTPHLPHGWDAGVLFEETRKTLLCSDLFTHNGDVEPITGSDITGRARQALLDGQLSPLADVTPYTSQTGRLLSALAALQPARLATMHGSSFEGDCSAALLDLSTVFREVLSDDRSGQLEATA